MINFFVTIFAGIITSTIMFYMTFVKAPDMISSSNDSTVTGGFVLLSVMVAIYLVVGKIFFSDIYQDLEKKIREEETND